MVLFRTLILILGLWLSLPIKAHPLRLSLCEIEYSSKKQTLNITLKLFLTDVNEALVLDPYSNELAFCQDNESPNANKMLLAYLKQFFHVKINSQSLNFVIDKKNLKGEGDNTALWLYFEFPQKTPVSSLEVKNAVFTDLFFDQNNIVYIHNDKNSDSVMLNKEQPIHQLNY